MQISDVKLFIVNKGGNVEFGLGNTANYVILTIHTDRGIKGVGEAFHSLDEPIEGCVTKYKRWLIGEDPTKVLHHWQAIYRGLRYPLGTAELAALSAVEQALWDIAGKDCGLPIYKMLGGPSRDRVRGYASGGCWPSGNHGTFLEQVQAVVEAGWPALKFSPQVEEYAYDPPADVAPPAAAILARRARRHGGPGAQGAGNSRRRRRDLPRLPRPQHFSRGGHTPGQGNRAVPPVLSRRAALTENPDSLVQIKGQTAIPDRRWRTGGAPRPVQVGDRETGRRHSAARADGVRRNPRDRETRGGGGALPRRAGASPRRKPGGLCACAHTDVGSPLNRDLFSGMPRVTGGWIEMTGAPGIGLEFNEEAAGDHPPKTWDRPVVIEADGSIGLE